MPFCCASAIDLFKCHSSIQGNLFDKTMLSSVMCNSFLCSELLLSAEANIVTYLDREGSRTHHVLRDVMESGRADIVKRLKYTKDIMYRLINLQN